MNTDFGSVELSQRQFETISRLVYQVCGINFQAGKEGLIKSRLMKRLRALGMNDFDQYLDHITSDQAGQELITMIDALTTNKTSFFREAEHFDYLRREVLPPLVVASAPIRLWSAGCSSGEEAYSLAMLLCEEIPRIDKCDARILATDISTSVLKKAQTAIYEAETLSGLPAQLTQKYLTYVTTQQVRGYRIKDNVRALVNFSWLNLMADWPMRGPFQAIFCRNVMIYFDKATQQALVNRFWKLLEPGGHLFVGHSESLTALTHEFRYVQPAVYVK